MPIVSDYRLIDEWLIVENELQGGYVNGYHFSRANRNGGLLGTSTVFVCELPGFRSIIIKVDFRLEVCNDRWQEAVLEFANDSLE